MWKIRLRTREPGPLRSDLGGRQRKVALGARCDRLLALAGEHQAEIFRHEGVQRRAGRRADVEVEKAAVGIPVVDDVIGGGGGSGALLRRGWTGRGPDR